MGRRSDRRAERAAEREREQAAAQAAGRAGKRAQAQAVLAAEAAARAGTPSPPLEEEPATTAAAAGAKRRAEGGAEEGPGRRTSKRSTAGKHSKYDDVGAGQSAVDSVKQARLHQALIELGSLSCMVPTPADLEEDEEDSTQVLSPEFKALLVKAVERTREAHPDKARVLLEKIFKLSRAIAQQSLPEEGEAGELERVEFKGITLEVDDDHPDSVLVHM